MSDKLHIGQFITQYPYPDQFSGSGQYFCSGAERVAQDLSEELSRQGHRVSVYTTASNASYSTEEQDGVHVRRSPTLHSINTTQISPTEIFDPFLHRPDFDVVHAHNSTPPGVITAWAYSKSTGTPLIITHHGGENYKRHGSLTRRLGLSIYTDFLINPIFKSADAVVSPTKGYIDESSALQCVEHVDVIPNGVDVSTFNDASSPEDAKRELGIPLDTFLVLYLGSLHPRKGVQVLLDGFLQFHQSVPQSHLIVGGSGQLREELENTVDAREQSSAVSFSGFIPEEEKPRYMRAADVFVLPSVTPGSEVFPLVLLEAAAAGTPVLASDFDTIRSILGSNSIGSLIEPGDPDSIAFHLDEVYSDDELLHQYSENAAQKAKDHSWSEIARKYLNLYKRVIK